METALLFVTVVSSALALGAAFLVWRMRNREEARQRARVAALSAAINGPAVAFEADPTVEPEAVAAWDPAGLRLDDVAIGHLRASEAQTRADAPALFAETEPAVGTPRRGPALALAAGVAVVLMTGALMLGSPRERVPHATSSAPLELLSLEQRQDGTQTVISGLVRNPAAGQPVRRLTAVVLFYDGAGAFVASSRAPLDYTTLRPGEESPFSVSLQDASPSATRYRLSFRLDDSGAVPHVDRRAKS